MSWWQPFFTGPWAELQAAGYPAERTRTEVDFIATGLGLAPGQRVLDVPCGEGRHAIELAARGMRVTGVDFNAGALAAARERAGAAGVAVDFVQADMRELAITEPFDAALCFFGSFGYFDDADNLRFATRVARGLREGGKFLIDGHVTESLLPIFGERGWSWSGEPAASVRVLEERRWDLETSRIDVDWTFVDPQRGVRTSQSSIRVYTYAELCALLRSAGFRAFQGVETGTARPFMIGARRLSLIATR